jgi:hypothetical protein
MMKIHWAFVKMTIIFLVMVICAFNKRFLASSSMYTVALG